MNSSSGSDSDEKLDDSSSVGPENRWPERPDGGVRQRPLGLTSKRRPRRRVVGRRTTGVLSEHIVEAATVALQERKLGLANEARMQTPHGANNAMPLVQFSNHRNLGFRNNIPKIPSGMADVLLKQVNLDELKTTQLALTLGNLKHTRKSPWPQFYKRPPPPSLRPPSISGGRAILGSAPGQRGSAYGKYRLPPIDKLPTNKASPYINSRIFPYQ